VLTHVPDNDVVDAQIIDLEDLMKAKLYKTGDEYFTKDDVDTWANYKAIGTAFAEREECEVTVPVGSTNAVVTLKGSVMEKPRDCGLRIYIGMAQLYDILQMSWHSGHRANWVEHMLPRWEKAKCRKWSLILRFRLRGPDLGFGVKPRGTPLAKIAKLCLGGTSRGGGGVPQGNSPIHPGGPPQHHFYFPKRSLSV